MGAFAVLGCISGMLAIGLCIRRIFCRPQPAAFGTVRDDFKFSIDPADFRSDGSRRLPDIEAADELEIDRELQHQMERARLGGSGPSVEKEGMMGAIPRDSNALIGDLTSEGQLSQEAFEAEMRAELAEFDKMADDALPPAGSVSRGAY